MKTYEFSASNDELERALRWVRFWSDRRHEFQSRLTAVDLGALADADRFNFCERRLGRAQQRFNGCLKLKRT